MFGFKTVFLWCGWVWGYVDLSVLFLLIWWYGFVVWNVVFIEMALEVGLVVLYASFIPSYSWWDICILDEIISEMCLKDWSVWTNWRISLMGVGFSCETWWCQQPNMLVVRYVGYFCGAVCLDFRATCLVFWQLGLSVRAPAPIKVAASVV